MRLPDRDRGAVRRRLGPKNKSRRKNIENTGVQAIARKLDRKCFQSINPANRTNSWGMSNMLPSQLRNMSASPGAGVEFGFGRINPFSDSQ
jgi:hypothetical protein